MDKTRHHRLTLRFRWLYLAIVCVCLAGAWTGEKIVQDREFKRMQADHLVHANMLVRQFQSLALESEIVSNAVLGLFSKSPNISQDEFARFVDPLISNSPSIINVAAAPNLVVEYVYPMEGNQAVLGLDYRDIPEQFASVMRVSFKEGVVFEGPFNLVQGGVGFIDRIPLFMNDTKDFWGIISVVSSVQSMIENSGIDAQSSQLKYGLRTIDVGTSSGPKLLWGDETAFADGAAVASSEFRGGRLELAIQPIARLGIASNHYVVIWAVAALSCLGFLAFARTLYKQYQSREDAQQKLSAAINSIRDGFVLWDASDRLVHANEKYLSFFTLSRHLFKKGETFENIIRGAARLGQYPEAIGRVDDWVAQRLAAHQKPQGASILKLTDGRVLQISEAKTPDGGTVGLRVDITELTDMKEKAEAANVSKTQFMNSVSHELKTPLTAILGYSTFLSKVQVLPSFVNMHNILDQSDDPKCRLVREAFDEFSTTIQTYADKIESSGQNLQSLIDDVLLWANHEVLADRRTDVAADVGKSIQRVVRKYTPPAQDKNITLKGTSQSEVAAIDPKMLDRALSKIVENAVKFSDAGAIEIWTKSDRASLSIHVKDQGIGIPFDQQDMIFDHYFQIDNSRTREIGGTGLGLSIALMIVEANKGRIEVESTVGQGSTFTVVLPLADQNGATQTPKSLQKA